MTHTQKKKKNYLKALWKNPRVFCNFDRLVGRQICDSNALWRSGTISKGATAKDIHLAATGTFSL